MKSFLRENPTIAFGLGLPLLLVAVFLLVSGLPAFLVASPQYDVLYSTGYVNDQNGIQISVVNRKVQVIYQYNRYSNRKPPRLWRYNPKTEAVKEIPILWPANPVLTGKRPATSEYDIKRTLINVPDLKGLTVDSSNIAPDGYKFNRNSGRYSRGLFDGGLFHSAYYRYGAVLTKNGRSVQLPNVDAQYYNNAHLIGWVVLP